MEKKRTEFFVTRSEVVEITGFSRSYIENHFNVKPIKPALFYMHILIDLPLARLVYPRDEVDAWHEKHKKKIRKSKKYIYAVQSDIFSAQMDIQQLCEFFGLSRYKIGKYLKTNSITKNGVYYAVQKL